MYVNSRKRRAAEIPNSNTTKSQINSKSQIQKGSFGISILGFIW